MNDSFDTLISNEEIYVSSCHRELEKGFKYSFHIVITTTGHTIAFEGATYCKYFVNLVLNKCIDLCDTAEEAAIFKKCIDISPYKVKQNFRLIGHHKGGSDQSVFIPVQKYGNPDLGRLPYIITWIPQDIRILPVVEQIDNLMDIYSNNRQFISFNTEQSEFLETLVRSKCHRSAFVVKDSDANGFMHWNYTDRKERCFASNLEHDQIGFFIYREAHSDMILAGCFSANCTNEHGKKLIIKLGAIEQPIDTTRPIRQVDLNEVYDEAPFHVVDRCIQKSAVGICDIFQFMYCNPPRIVFIPSKDNPKGKMYLWNGMYWEEDDSDFVNFLISKTIPHVLEQYLQRLSQQEDSGSVITYQNESVDLKIKKVVKLIDQLYQLTINERIVKGIKNCTKDRYFESKLDRLTNQLSLKNGILDLKTGELRHPKPQDYITKYLNIEYDPNADSSEFDTFVKSILSDENGERPDLYHYFRCLVGYVLQGNPIHKMLIVFYGPHGYNGKSVFCDILNTLFGHYTAPLDPSVVFVTPKKSAGSATPELVNLDGPHVAIITDTAEGQVLHAGQVKQLTSAGDIVPVRGLFKNQKPVKFRLVPIIASNYTFQVNPKDNAIRQRLHIVPFKLSFIPNPTKPHERLGDPNIKEKLMENKSGIFKWFIECSMHFYFPTGGMPVKPQCVLDEIDDYYIKMDDVLHFLKERTERSTTSTTTIALYNEYLRFHDNYKQGEPIKKGIFIRDVKLLRGYTPDTKSIPGIEIKNEV